MFLVVLLETILVSAGTTGGACHGGDPFSWIMEKNPTDSDVHPFRENLSTKLDCFHHGYLSQMKQNQFHVNGECLIDFRACPEAENCFNLDPRYYDSVVTEISQEDCRIYYDWGTIYACQYLNRLNHPCK